jgi:hypothetical protein
MAGLGHGQNVAIRHTKYGQKQQQLTSVRPVSMEWEMIRKNMVRRHCALKGGAFVSGF